MMTEDQIEKEVKEEFDRVAREAWGTPKIYAIRKYMDLTGVRLGKSKVIVERMIQKWND
ncbi:hypothetical protein [Paenibacillus kribbensis]|uniref:hypothetical protein n=1 Tax=Paenibacillus kribbensis TaxID=172713 RepID=UPI00159F213A|nr:hypothetical protein [Paenibacillus kribbensis]